MWAEETSILSICTKCDGRRDLSWVEEEKFHNRTYHMADERLPTSVHIAIPYGSKARNLVEVIDNVLALISRNAVDEVVDVTEKEGAE